MIKVVGVIKSFDAVKALDGVSCKMRSGAIYGMLGSNGAGKSTLMRIIAGIMKPDGGTVLIEDLPVYDHPAIKERVFLVPDDPYYIGQASMQDMARFYARFYPAFDWDIYHQLADLFPLDPKRRMNTFSKGMVRQAALILAFSTQPSYLLLDEAFDGLDAVMRRALKGVISEWVQTLSLIHISIYIVAGRISSSPTTKMRSLRANVPTALPSPAIGCTTVTSMSTTAR